MPAAARETVQEVTSWWQRQGSGRKQAYLCAGVVCALLIGSAVVVGAYQAVHESSCERANRLEAEIEAMERKARADIDYTKLDEYPSLEDLHKLYDAATEAIDDCRNATFGSDDTSDAAQEEPETQPQAEPPPEPVVDEGAFSVPDLPPPPTPTPTPAPIPIPASFSEEMMVECVSTAEDCEAAAIEVRLIELRQTPEGIELDADFTNLGSLQLQDAQFSITIAAGDETYEFPPESGYLSMQFCPGSTARGTMKLDYPSGSDYPTANRIRRILETDDWEAVTVTMHRVLHYGSDLELDECGASSNVD
jgi:hypothetical protein